MSRETYLEFTQVGAYMRVAAIDGDTGIEVVVMGPATAARADLERLARAKLDRALAQARNADADTPSAPPSRGGRLV